MNIEPDASTHHFVAPPGVSSTSNGKGAGDAQTAQPVAGPSRSAPARRQLRARPSEPIPTSSPASRTQRSESNAALRRGSEHELEYIRTKLGPENISSRRDVVVRAKEAELKEVVDQHDTAVKEKFHLERYISIFEGWDPKSAKQDNSPVFLDYKRANHNLLDLAPSVATTQAEAGPSRHRHSGPSRTTRRRAIEQAELFSSEAPIETPKSDTKSGASAKGKGKARASDVSGDAEEIDRDGKRGRPKVNGNDKATSPNEMPPPPLPTKSKGKRRRATISVDEAVIGDEVDVEEPEPDGKGKKRGRQSLPNLPTKKGRKSQKQLKEEEDTALLSPNVETPADEVEAEAVAPEPSPAPVLPSLAHLPFPEPPHRPRQRPRGTRKIYYTDYPQLPTGNIRYDGDIEPILDSYILLEDSGPPPDLKALELRAAREAYFQNRVNYLQQQGRLLRLLDEEDEGLAVASTSKASTKQTVLPARSTDYQDSLMAHMIQVRNAMLNEAKSKPLVCRRIAKMIQAYWDHIEGKEERERLAEERERKKQMKDLVKALRKRWALAIKVVRAKLLQIQKEEQDRLGKEHLQNMLQRSTGLIEAHRDEFAGREDEDEEDEMDEDDSDGTEAVSAAEDSGEEVSGEDQDNDEEDEIERAEGDNADTPAQATAAESLGLGDDFDIPAEMDGMDDVNQGDHQAESTDMPIDVNDHATDLDSSSEADVAEDEPTDLRALLLEETVATTAAHGADEETAPNGHVDAATALATSDPERTPLDVSTSVAIAMVPDPALKARFPETVDRGDIEPPEVSTIVSEPSRGRQAVASETVPPAIGGTAADRDASEPNALAATPASLPPLRAPSRRKRKSTGFGGFNVNSSTSEAVDSSVNDVDFKVEVSSDQDDKDRELDEEMEDADADADGHGASEDEGLLADADLPIEELLKRYGYEMPNGHHLDDTKNGLPDQSLTDQALAKSPPSPAVVVEGKRQRRIRSVWTPEDNPPPPPKKPKIEVIPDEVESDASTPKFTSSEDEDDEDEDEEDVEADGQAEGGDGAAKDEEDPNRLRAPFLLRGTLRPYQHDGLEWLASLYANNMNGILADEMGLGKTIQTIALLAHLACDKGIWGQHLIIVPTSVILNWEMEFKKFLPGIKVLTYYGNQKERKEKRIGWQTQHHFQVCITSYQIVLADQHIFRRKNWVYMILDEAHNIKNFRSQRWQTLLGFKAQKRLLLTGTPLQNNLMELWSLLYFLMPGGVTEDRTSVVGFANHKEFTEWFSNPMDKAVESGDVIDEETLATVNKLHTLLRPFILRRLKSEVETQLPGKFEHVVYCRLSKRQRFLYDEFMSRASTKEALTSGGYLGVVNTLMQLRKVCNHPDLFEVRPVRTSFAMDPIALDYEPVELLVRKRLLARSDDTISLNGLNLDITAHEDLSAWTCESRRTLDASDRLPYAIEPITTGKRVRGPQPPKLDTLTVDGWSKYRAWHEEQKSVARWRSLRNVNRLRCGVRPVYGSTFLDILTDIPNALQPESLPSIRGHSFGEHSPPASTLIRSHAERAVSLEPVVDLYAVIPPNVVARDLTQYALPGLTPSSHPLLTDPEFDTLHASTVKLQIAFPDASLLQYDCGKLQTLYEMLRDLKANGHRVLIFTQMTRVLDILEMFLSYNGHRYLRLDGSTKIEDRQIITERFNSDSRIFCFIASSRSGGVGINLTGADTVFFYDSDWNPSMDRQCMDRAHRIGQTREVNIYRFVSTHTVEENMLKKANQKRLLDKVVIQEGEFTTDFFGKMDWRDVIDVEGAGGDGGGNNDTDGSRGQGAKVQNIEVEDEPMAVDQDTLRPRMGEERELAKALAEVEDEEDAVAARVAQGEGELDFAEFGGENKRVVPKRVDFDPSAEGSGTPITPAQVGEVADVDGDMEAEGEEDEEDDVGGVDEYMLRLVEWDWAYFVNYRA